MLLFKIWNMLSKWMFWCYHCIARPAASQSTWHCKREQSKDDDQFQTRLPVPAGWRKPPQCRHYSPSLTTLSSTCLHSSSYPTTHLTYRQQVDISDMYLLLIAWLPLFHVDFLILCCRPQERKNMLKNITITKSRLIGLPTRVAVNYFRIADFSSHSEYAILMQQLQFV